MSMVRGEPAQVVRENERILAYGVVHAATPATVMAAGTCTLCDRDREPRSAVARAPKTLVPWARR